MTIEVANDVDVESPGMARRAWAILRRVLIRLGPVIGLAVICGALWAAFRWVITDPNLTLAYVKVVAWPVVVGGALYGLRAPIREKFRELLKIEALGVTADFKERSAEKLSSELGPDLDAVSGGRRRRRARLDEDLEDEGSEDEGSEEEGSEGEGSEGEAVQGAGTSEPHNEVVPSDMPVTPPEAPKGHLSEHAAFLIRLNDALGGSPRMDETVRTKQEAAERMLLKRARYRTEQARRSRERKYEQQAALESIIRKSADWGYEMGKSGAPRVVPDIEWGSDGHWRITTEVPASKSRATEKRSESGSSTYFDSAEQRHIAALEGEIRSLEQDDTFRLKALQQGIKIPEDPYLHLLKKRLRRIDPHNPLAMD